MVRSVNALILKTNKLEESLNFYQTVGLSLEQEEHGEGPTHYAGKIGPTHFAIYEMDPWKEQERRTGKAREIMVGFEIDDLNATLESLKAIKAPVVIEPEDVPWGRRAVVMDPDARPVELNEAQPHKR